MRHRILVTVPNALQHLPTQISGVVFRVALPLADPIEQIPAGHELHDEEVTLALLEEVDEGANVGVTEGREDEHLVVDGGVVAGGQVLAEDALDRDLLARGAVGAAANGGEGAGFEPCVQLINLSERPILAPLRKHRKLHPHQSLPHVQRHVPVGLDVRLLPRSLRLELLRGVNVPREDARRPALLRDGRVLVVVVLVDLVQQRRGAGSHGNSHRRGEGSGVGLGPVQVRRRRYDNGSRRNVGIDQEKLHVVPQGPLLPVAVVVVLHLLRVFPGVDQFLLQFPQFLVLLHPIVLFEVRPDVILVLVVEPYALPLGEELIVIRPRREALPGLGDVDPKLEGPMLVLGMSSPFLLRRQRSEVGLIVSLKSELSRLVVEGDERRGIQRSVRFGVVGEEVGGEDCRGDVFVDVA
mmetsp:Transcript_10438/g.22107  ORF Transcript_10438/g.22107 Transcript_10438/m.22107 type:complete len:410 (-) Transcript_10438:936-2165(-)